MSDAITEETRAAWENHEAECLALLDKAVRELHAIRRHVQKPLKPRLERLAKKVSKLMDHVENSLERLRATQNSLPKR